mmetsp:Transcript_21307/g.70625  ORF Transcript_21307/g.70625 Transcript_21307/m.70625 type:complete len:924 (-) Transcript_21307:72-2843(-)
MKRIRCGGTGVSAGFLLVCSPLFLLACLGSAKEARRCPEQFRTAKEQRGAGEMYMKRAGAEDGKLAAACFEAALKSYSYGEAQERGEVGMLLADALEMAGDVKAATNQIKEMMSQFPTSPVPHFKLGNVARATERWEEAVGHYRKAIALAPQFVNARVNLAMAFRGMNRLDDAIQSYREALEYEQERADVFVNFGVTLDAAGKMEEAKEAYEKAIALDPLLYQAYFNFGVLMAESFKDREAGIKLYHQSLKIEPNFPDAYHTLGNIYTTLGKYEEAKRFLEMAVALRPDDSRFHNSLGMLADALGDNQAALRYYQRSVNQSPRSPAAIINAAKVLNSQARYKEAEAMCMEAIRIDPKYGEAYCQLGDVYKDSEQIGLSVQAYSEGIKLAPGYEAGFCNFFYATIFACHWEGRGRHVKRLREIMKGYLQGKDPLIHECVQPFQSLAYPLEPEELLAIASFHANKAAVHVSGVVGKNFKPFPLVRYPLIVHAAHNPHGEGSRKLRIGFVSADYKDHPVVKDLIHMFSMFDRSSVDIFCFALNPAAGPVGWEEKGWHEDGGPGPHRMWRNRVAKHCTLIDVSSMNDPQAATSINEQRMHILFNIMGYTQGERNEIFALRPAPLQVLYKGFVGTLGAAYVGHMVTDVRVSPPEFQEHYKERLLYMPHTYVVNDYRQQHAEFVPSADDFPIEKDFYGLPPEAKIIYCNFNQQYKVDPPTLKAWVQVLLSVPGSVMWLIRFGTSNAAEEAIQREAEKMGLDDPTRIFFTDPTPRRIHLQVKSLADVFLDTPQYNGHGTATDALWASIPLVTYPVRKMSSRAAASFVYASAGQGRTTLVRSMKDYVDVAVKLGRKKNRKKLRKMKKELEEGRFKSPMFDTRRWVKTFQKLIRMLWDAHADGIDEISVHQISELLQQRKMHVVAADIVPPS